MAFGNRRVVTGLNAQGKSCVLVDTGVDDLAVQTTTAASIALIWRTTEVPAENDGGVGEAERFEPAMFESSSSLFILFEAQPDTPPVWHATNTVDYVIVLRGSIALDLEEGPVELRSGDLVVDRGVNHSWRVIGDEPALLAAALVRALPVGAGSRFDDSFERTFTG